MPPHPHWTPDWTVVYQAVEGPGPNTPAHQTNYIRSKRNNDINEAAQAMSNCNEISYVFLAIHNISPLHTIPLI